MSNKLFLLVVVLLFTGCQIITKEEIAFQKTLDMQSETDIRSYINDKTVLRNMYQFKNAVLYFSPKGHGFWWVKNTYLPEYFTWKIEKHELRYVLCLSHPDLYAALQSNHLLSGSKDQYCKPMSVFLSRRREFRETDIFNLSSRRLPFIRKTDKQSLSGLMKQAANN